MASREDDMTVTKKVRRKCALLGGTCVHFVFAVNERETFFTRRGRDATGSGSCQGTSSWEAKVMLFLYWLPLPLYHSLSSNSVCSFFFFSMEQMYDILFILCGDASHRLDLNPSARLLIGQPRRRSWDDREEVFPQASRTSKEQRDTPRTTLCLRELGICRAVSIQTTW